MGRTSSVRITVKALLDDARGRLDRLTPAAAWDEASGTAVLVDIRSDSQRERDGVVPGATVIPRNVLEWRLDPESATRIPAVAVRGNRVILLCDEGYQSSLAAATLRRFGLDAADVVGGVQA